MHGRTHGRTDGQRENSIPPTNKVCGGYNKSEAIIIYLTEHFEHDFLWKVSLKILNSGSILKTFTHAFSIKNSAHFGLSESLCTMGLLY